MKRKVVFMIDGWFMRKRIYSLKTFFYDGPSIRRYCKSHLRPDDYLYRIFYYDTEPLDKKGHNPITRKLVDFNRTTTAKAQQALLESIKKTPNFALRLGETVWTNKNWVLEPGKLKALLSKKISVDDLDETDVRPLIQQKTVDMKMGIDLALIATNRLADLLIMIAGDSDIVPALKLARREGMQVCLDPLRSHIRPELSEHVDFISTQIPAS
ncbi:MAG: NYN domain-containing protein [Desulfobacterales bacterium]|nr:NYN domain-containing protein [Desulfobacterales bacterium]